MGAGIQSAGREEGLEGLKLSCRTGGDQGRHREDRLPCPLGCVVFVADIVAAIQKPPE